MTLSVLRGVGLLANSLLFIFSINLFYPLVSKQTLAAKAAQHLPASTFVNVSSEERKEIHTPF
jgi:hypothetical protein